MFKEITIKGKLVADSIEGMGYTNYVFENLNFQDYDYQYITCIKFPNWNQGIINIGDVGYVLLRYVQEGVDEWFDGEKFNKYTRTNIIFIKFIKESPMVDNIIVVD